MYTNNNVKDHKVKVYKVIVEHVATGELQVLYRDSTSSYLAGQLILESLGEGYDLLKSIGSKPSELN